MPDWLINNLTQFPIVVAIGFVAWYAYGQMKETTGDRQRSEERMFNAHLAKTEDLYQRLIAAKEAEIARLKDETAALTGEVRKVRIGMDALVRKFDARFGGQT